MQRDVRTQKLPTIISRRFKNRDTGLPRPVASQISWGPIDRFGLGAPPLEPNQCYNIPQVSYCQCVGCQ